MPQYATYQERSRAFLEKAYIEFEQGDLLQASEKGWGAAAQMLKAIAAERGWHHGRHGQLFVIVRRLANEEQIDGLRFGFRAARTLHANFYEDWMEMAEVEENLDRVREFVDAAEQLLSGR